MKRLSRAVDKVTGAKGMFTHVVKKSGKHCLRLDDGKCLYRDADQLAHPAQARHLKTPVVIFDPEECDHRNEDLARIGSRVVVRCPDCGNERDW